MIKLQLSQHFCRTTWVSCRVGVTLCCDFYTFRIVASLRLKNERGERLRSHRSDLVTGGWGWLHNLCKVQSIFPHLCFQQVQLCSQPSHPFIPIVTMHFYSICKFFFSLSTNFLTGIWCFDKSINLFHSFYSDIFVLSWSKFEHKTEAELYWNYWIHPHAN